MQSHCIEWQSNGRHFDNFFKQGIIILTSITHIKLKMKESRVNAEKKLWGLEHRPTKNVRMKNLNFKFEKKIIGNIFLIYFIHKIASSWTTLFAQIEHCSERTLTTKTNNF